MTARVALVGLLVNGKARSLVQIDGKLYLSSGKSNAKITALNARAASPGKSSALLLLLPTQPLKVSSRCAILTLSWLSVSTMVAQRPLGVGASLSDLERLDVTSEKANLEQPLHDLREGGVDS